MWFLLKAEIHYNRYLLLIAFAAMVAIGVLGVSALENMEWMVWLPFFLIFENLNKTYLKEKRSRLIATLPVPVRQLGSTRIALQYLIFFSVAMLWYPFFYQSGHPADSNDAWLLIATGLMVINVFSAAIIKQDLRAAQQKWRRRFWYCVAGYVALLVALFSLVIVYRDHAEVPAWIAWITAYPVIPIVTLLPVPVLYFVAIRSYSHRQTYLEEGTKSCG